jgi:hypothetical protein
MRYATLTLIFWLALAGGSPGFAAEGALSAAPFLWWSVGTAQRLADGRTEQTLTLVSSSAIGNTRPEVRLRIMPSSPQSGNGGKIFWRKGEWASSAPYALIVQSGEYAVADVFARAEIGGLPHYAQTRLLLYGQGDKPDTTREVLGEAPDWPEFHVRFNGGTYWPQTGHEFSVSFRGEHTGPLEVRGGQGELLEVMPADSAYAYTAPHDPELNRAGPAAAKLLVFVLRAPEGGTASFTQMVHRSRYAFWDQKAGLLVFAGAFLASGLAALLARRKARPCC